MHVTIHDVAARAGVSPATVSLVLNGRPCRVSENTRQRVRQAAQELGFRSAAPRPLVGILLPDISNLFFSSIGQAFLLEARAQGNDAIVMVHGDQPGQDLANLDTLLSRGVGGVVMVRSARTTPEEEDTLREKILKSRIPVVVMDRKMDIPNVKSVLLDNREGARMAVRYLLEQGHTRIGCITGPLEDVVCRERLLGYQDALEEAAIAYDESLICQGDYRPEDGVKYLPYLLGKSVTGIFCFNDMIALGVYTGCRAYHLRIPADLSVIGYDGIPFCETLDVPLSTVEQPVEEMGRAAATLLKQMMYQPQCAQDRLFLPSLQIRASTASPTDPSRR